ncbi:thiamine phosphate synthase [Zobellia galactanivorans]|uniref:Thiamine-phosphate synthase-like protein n=1 Tax=Zobellia galactanivorans (strain DSM 12802 / CCUG 47099 / CIP 106680 / NCIMB 13871 / Dsij) TaxID=63186 RepID=G0L1P2_ZOBGA|nr:thiamine-phosphate pyrophosphorylase [Zobellia galactanivorans]CAZ97793.1 Thiamine-phosphate synthase-like protein [Zobellia galactanivorans]
MIVLIAPETDVPNELETLNHLFQEGLEYYHLRKPNKDYTGHVAYMNGIDKAYHNRVVVHLYHRLIADFDLKGIHFQEQKRREVLEKGALDEKTPDTVMQHYAALLEVDRSKIKSISSSFHEPNELQGCNFEFDYHLLSPVFSSISKKGYEGRGFNVNHIDKRIIGMGGVTKNNLPEIQKLGFRGVGVLGGIWNSKTPIEEFRAMQEFYRN